MESMTGSRRREKSRITTGQVGEFAVIAYIAAKCDAPSDATIEG